jgi:DNA-binding CsgD family transcriptional regulator
LSAPTISPSPLHAAAVAEQLLDLAGRLAAVADPGAPGQAARAVGARQVRAAVSALAAEAGTVTWLRIRAAGHEPATARPSADDPVAGPLLARAGPVRVLVCAPGTGPARALADAHRGAPAGSLRLVRSGAALHGTRGDLVVATRADAIAVVSDPDGTPRADAVAGAAANALVRGLVDSLWDGALPPVSAERIEEVAHDPVKLEILGLLESGAKDEVIARALGVSLRTCRRHIAELLSATDAVSRFQAASRLARAGLLSTAR